jgi:hypothetical protein
MALAQDQPLPLMPPNILYGMASVDSNSAQAGDEISVRMSRLLIMFLDSSESQSDIDLIIGAGGLANGNTGPLRDAFEDPVIGNYCIDHGISLSQYATAQSTGPDTWRVIDGSRTYAVEYTSGKKLEVYLNDGEIASYDIGDPVGKDQNGNDVYINEPGYNYMVSVPMNPVDMPSSADPYLREPGTALDNEEFYVCINDVRTLDQNSNQYTITVGSLQNFVPRDIDAPSWEDWPISLEVGGNMISFPLQPLDTSRDSIISDIESKIKEIWAYDPTNPPGSLMGWFLYDPDDPGFSNMPGVMQSGAGYWFEMNHSDTLTIRGTAYQQATEILLRAGGNLVGYNSKTEGPIKDCIPLEVMSHIDEIWAYDPTNPPGSLMGWFWYDPDDEGNSNLENMYPGMGYWIEANSDVIWNLEP